MTSEISQPFHSQSVDKHMPNEPQQDEINKMMCALRRLKSACESLLGAQVICWFYLCCGSNMSYCIMASPIYKRFIQYIIMYVMKNCLGYH